MQELSVLVTVELLINQPAKSLDFIAAADRPNMAACFTFSGETDGEAPVWKINDSFNIHV